MSEATLEIESGRDPDGDVHIDMFVNHDNQLSISVSERGHMNWAGVINGVSHHNVVADQLGTIIYRLLNENLPDEYSDNQSGEQK